MNHKLTTTTPFILLGLDADSFHNDKLMKMFRERVDLPLYFQTPVIT